MSADFFSIALPLDDAEAAALLPALGDAEQAYHGNIYVDATEEILGMIDDATPVAMSPNFPSFVALDRFGLEPRGALLGDRGFRWIARAELAGLRALLTASSRDQLIAQVTPQLERWGNGEDDVAAGLDALERGVALAEASGRGLLLVCIPC